MTDQREYNLLTERPINRFSLIANPNVVELTPKERQERLQGIISYNTKTVKHTKRLKAKKITFAVLEAMVWFSFAPIVFIWLKPAIPGYFFAMTLRLLLLFDRLSSEIKDLNKDILLMTENITTASQNLNKTIAQDK